MKKYHYFGKISSIKELVLFLLKLLPVFFSLTGGYWLLIEFSEFLFPKAGDFFKNYGLWGVLCMGLVSIWLCRPISSVSLNLQDRDVSIEINIGDFFKTKGDFVIASTTSFDTSLEDGTVSKDSLIGKFISTYFSNNPSLLTQQLDFSLKDEQYDSLPLDWTGNKRKYSIGTVARITLSDRNCYLVAINNKNKHGNVDTHNDSFEDVKTALARTWEYVEKRGDLRPLVIALIGTGRGRIKEKRIEVAKEIIKSFIAANTSSRFTDKLTVVIHPKDISENIDLPELVEFLQFQCKYTQFAENGSIQGKIISQGI